MVVKWTMFMLLFVATVANDNDDDNDDDRPQGMQ